MSAPIANGEFEAHDELFYTKSFPSDSGRQSIILQNENGPCALVAITNVLALQDTAMAAQVEQEPTSISESVLKSKLGEIASQMNATPESLASLFEFMPKLSKGLDVNPRFDGSFSPSPQLGIFYAFRIKLVHMWVLGHNERADIEMDLVRQPIQVTDVSQLSYEEACDLQITNPSEAVWFTKFSEQYPSQMTPSGYHNLKTALREDELAVLFWNNHFSTIKKYDGKLWILVTDLGFQNKREYIWEQIDPSGAGEFANGLFRPALESEERDAELARNLAKQYATEPSESPAPPTTRSRSASNASTRMDSQYPYNGREPRYPTEKKSRSPFKSLRKWFSS